MVIESVQSSLPRTALIFLSSTGNLVFARINLKPTVLKYVVFDWALCFRLCEVLRFSEFGRFGISNQTHPKKVSSISNSSRILQTEEKRFNYENFEDYRKVQR